MQLSRRTRSVSSSSAMGASPASSPWMAWEVTVRRLSSLGFKTARQRAARSTLAATGLALGVALLFGILVANASVNRVFHRLTPAQMQGNVSVQRVDNQPLSVGDIERIRSLPDASIVQ